MGGRALQLPGGQGSKRTSAEKSATEKAELKIETPLTYGNSEVYAIRLMSLTLELIIDVCRKHYRFPNKSTTGNPKTL